MTASPETFSDASASSRTAGGRLFGRWRDRVAAFDPALSRLRLASRAMLSLLLAAALLAAVTWFHQLPIAAYGSAIPIAFMGAMAINDRTAKEQMISRLYGALAAIVAILLASLLAPLPVVADIGFLAVVFGAVFIRKFGPRWFAIGMVAFMSYFMGDYLKPLPADIGWVALSVVLSFAATHIVTNFILPNDPERDFRRALETLDRRVNVILWQLRDAGRDHPDAIADRKILQGALAELRDIVLMAEGFMPQGEAGSLAAEGPAADLAVALFELQLAVERMVRASYIALPPADLIAAVLQGDATLVKSAAGRISEGAATPAEIAARLLLRVYRARTHLDTVLGPRPSPAFVPMATAVDTPKPAAAAPAAPPPKVSPALQAAIQVTLAAGIAMAGGLLLSPVRWYWALLTAFIVFNNTRSRADTVVKAVQRSAGTFGGLIAGTIVATLLQGQMVVSGVGILVLFFAAFYFLQTSYSLMIFLITIALALIYGIMGMFTPELLLLRLEETIVGAVSGAAVAFFVFPARVSVAAGTALAAYLAALRELVVAAQARAHGEAGAGNLVSLSRALDRRYVDLANAARPVGGPWGAVTRFGAVRERLLLLTAAAHWSRTLARSLRSGAALDAGTLTRIDVVAEEILARIAHAEAEKDNFFDRQTAGDVGVTAQRPALPISEDEDPAFSLEIISALLARATA